MEKRSIGRNEIGNRLLFSNTKLQRSFQPQAMERFLLERQKTEEAAKQRVEALREKKVAAAKRSAARRREKTTGGGSK